MGNNVYTGYQSVVISEDVAAMYFQNRVSILVTSIYPNQRGPIQHDLQICLMNRGNYEISF